jgi:hypothetical protein
MALCSRQLRQPPSSCGGAYTALLLHFPGMRSSRCALSPVRAHLATCLCSGTVVVVGARNNATVVVADVAAGKSVIHVIDAVLLPPQKYVEAALKPQAPLVKNATTVQTRPAVLPTAQPATIAAAAAASPQLSTLLAAVKASSLLGAATNASTAVTVFAPTNKVGLLCRDVVIWLISARMPCCLSRGTASRVLGSLIRMHMALVNALFPAPCGLSPLVKQYSSNTQTLAAPSPATAGVCDSLEDVEPDCCTAACQQAAVGHGAFFPRHPHCGQEQ